MKTDKLIFKIHDPNTQEITIQHILPILLNANAYKIENIVLHITKGNIT